MRLICSPALTPEDFIAMKEADQVGRYAQATVRADLERLLAWPQAVPATKRPATLIANGIIDVRIAFADHPSGIGSTTSWASSKTAKASGLASSAAPTRRGEPGASTTSPSRSSVAGQTKNTCFVPVITPILSGRYGSAAIRVFGPLFLEQVTQDQLAAIADDDLGRRHPGRSVASTAWPGADGQATAHGAPALVLADWEAKDYRGIVNFATGAGKTLTALEGVRRWTDSGGAAVIMVPGRELHAQWMREIDIEMPGALILPAGAGSSKADWQQLLPIFTAAGNSATSVASSS